MACSAALWGTDGLLRKPLADALPAATVVFWEHVIVLVLLLPWLPGALRALRRCSAREWLAVLAIGAGSSAAATALFTAAFRVGDAVTPLVLQKLQPVFVVLAASALLRERVRAGYLVFAVPALVGAWLLTFPNPFQVRVAAAQAALLAVGAAALWAAGTVLGRLVSRSLSPREVTVSRFATGLPAAAVVVWLQDAPVAVGWGNATGLVLLAVVPGLLALSLYYLGLRSTPASRATLAELAFPATAALIGVGLLGNHLTATQWLGFALVVAMVTALGWHERVRRVPVVQDRTGREEMVPG
ncbi:Threonine/homoserine efflux transporter RhtA [Streptoalloteichus tenebrarius]|uniref:Threonine/homoserine efflux transporter RhtA n=1 Tax=Streptoalloteichus tenebrarius (strain ATCC 17920 / DSM 40477 / JCM 4838 / CBS 697.72 / NBRC 16177 / NCIMB 11028 / NRRL B-12390 / A12253. 1 / ISP 5477) TaxID=1933 RepID=A0ABT1HV38_STRSD|nr:Threonine/homoserine efflux transporter RhtA [Streptoalloteichus tenebrarius]BFF02341.1 DMT family transporter [Streptoalloteichus tenebrarius]